jgi:hypothetical protein
MKRLFAIISLSSLVAGCSKHDTAKPEDQAVPHPPQAITQAVDVVPPPTPAPRIITGAFGWKLGQVVPLNLRAPLDNGFDSGSYFTKSTNFPPFASIGLALLNDGKIFSITASKGDATDDEKDLVVEALASKYGSTNLTVTNEDNKGFAGQRATWWSFDDGYAVINLNYIGAGDANMLIIYYTDHELQKQFEVEQKVRDDTKIGRISTNL